MKRNPFLSSDGPALVTKLFSFVIMASFGCCHGERRSFFFFYTLELTRAISKFLFFMQDLAYFSVIKGYIKGYYDVFRWYHMFGMGT